MERPQKDMCFVLMPFNAEFKNQWELAFIPAIEKAGLIPWRGDEEQLGTNMIISDVTKCISEAKIIIADLTGRNPNVMYELGLAHAAKKHVIMLAQSEDDVPFDIKHIRYLEYNDKDLTSLREKLCQRIRSTLDMNAKDSPDFFPELQIMNINDISELEYLRKKAQSIEVKVIPKSADIFFNNKLVGQSPQIIRINPNVDRNTISAVAPGYIEYHSEIYKKDFDSGGVIINLEKGDIAPATEKRLTTWLKYRRKDPENPVIMRSICAYLVSSNKREEAISEGMFLVKIVPEWFLSYNVLGYAFGHDEPKESCAYFRKVIALRPDHYLGYFNMACTESMMGNFENCLDNLETIINSPKALFTYHDVDKDLDSESDFDPIRANADFGARFEIISQKFKESRESVVPESC